ncbi:MAG TPA: phosphotransferase [Pseudonocardia sp.]
MITLPRSADDLTSAWLSGALGQDVRVVSPPERLSSFACQVYRVELSGPAGTPAGVVVKLPTHGPVRELLDGLGTYRREVVFYERVAPNCPLRTPRALVAELAEDSTDFVLVLEDLAPLTTGDQLAGLSPEQAGVVVDELARFHAWSWEAPLLAELADTFPPIDSVAGRALGEHWLQFFPLGWKVASGLAGDALTPRLSAFADHFADYIPLLLDELAAPRVLSHGELRADNLILDGANSPYFIDFQNAQQACGPRELAYLLYTSLRREDRRGQDERLVRRYWDGLVAAGITGYPWEKAWRQYRLGLADQLMVTVVACTQYEAADERGRQALTEMARRALQAIEDNSCLDLLEGA